MRTLSQSTRFARALAAVKILAALSVVACVAASYGQEPEISFGNDDFRQLLEREPANTDRTAGSLGEGLAAQHPDWALALGPASMPTTAKLFFGGSRETAFAPALHDSGSLSPVHGLRFLLLDSLTDFVSVAIHHAGEAFERARVAPIESSGGKVIGYRIDGEDPRTAGCVLAPAFFTRFSRELGSPFLAIVPSRNTVFVLKRDTTALDQMKTEIATVKNDSAAPVSLEIFEVSDKGIKAVGKIGTE